MPYDRSGAIASSGMIDRLLLGRLQEHPFFHRKPPRSAWRLDFGEGFANGVLTEWERLPNEDIVATLTEFTAWSIATSLKDHVDRLDDMQVLIASGGGVYNEYLLRRLQSHVPPGLRILKSDEFGITAKFKEAVKFATLAFAYQHRLANNIPAASGTGKFTILGKMVLPPRSALMSAQV